MPAPRGCCSSSRRGVRRTGTSRNCRPKPGWVGFVSPSRRRKNGGDDAAASCSSSRCGPSTIRLVRRPAREDRAARYHRRRVHLGPRLPLGAALVELEVHRVRGVAAGAAGDELSRACAGAAVRDEMVVNVDLAPDHRGAGRCPRAVGRDGIDVSGSARRTGRHARRLPDPQLGGAIIVPSWAACTKDASGTSLEGNRWRARGALRTSRPIRWSS